MTSTSPQVRSGMRSPVFSPAGLNPSVVFEVPATWYPRVYAINITPYAHNLPCGSKHLSLSAIQHILFPGPGLTYPYSTYFDPYSPYFHLSAGAFIVAPVDGKRVPPEILSALSTNDMVAYLKRFRDPEPIASVGEVILTPTGTDRWYLEFTSNRYHLVVGSHMQQEGVPALFAVPNKPITGTKHWSDLVDDYADVDEVLAFGDIYYHNDYLIWNWCMGIRFVDKMGQVHDSRDHPREFEEMKQIANSARIIDRGIGIIPPPAYQPTGNRKRESR